MEIPASVIGKVISIEVSVGDMVSSGSPFLQIEISEDSVQQSEEDSLEDDTKKNQIVSELDLNW